jgi:hypothetical protein
MVARLTHSTSDADEGEHCGLAFLSIGAVRFGAELRVIIADDGKWVQPDTEAEVIGLELLTFRAYRKKEMEV